MPNSIKNSVWNVIDAATYPVAYLALVPVMMKGLGAEVFGLWIVLNTLIVTFQLFNLNTPLTTIRKISAYAATQEYQKINLVFSGILRIVAMLLFITVLVGAALTYILHHRNFLGIDERVAGSITVCVLMTTIIAGLKYYDQVFQAVLKAYEKYKPAAILNLLNRVGLLLINVILALLHSNIIHLLWANLIFTTLYLALQLLVIKRLFPFMEVSLLKGRRYTKHLVYYSMSPWLQSIIVLIAFQTDRFWVASFAGLKEVSAYGLTATMFNHIHMIFVAMGAWVFPRISGTVAKGGNPEELYNQVRGLLFTVTTLILIVFYYLSPLLFELWVGRTTYQDMKAYIKAFTVFELLFIHTIMPFFYLNAAGKEKEGTKLILLYGAGCYALMIVGLYATKQPVYMVYGMTLALCVTMPVINLKVKMYLSGKNDWKLIFLEMLPSYLAALCILFSYNPLTIILLPVLLITLYKPYLSYFLKQKPWKQPVNL